MPSSALVSVIIPAYNAERYLAMTLASAQSQTHDNLEIIIIDDGSTDSTAEIAEVAARNDHRVRLLRQKNLGVAAARNRGLAEATGEFIAPLDADDVWHACNIELQVKALQDAGPGVAVSYAWYVVIDECGKFCSAGPQSKFRRKSEVLHAQMEGNFIGNSSSSVLRRSSLRTVTGYDLTLRQRDAEGCEDQALYISLAREWDYTFVPEYLVAYRKHPGSMSQDRERMMRSQALVLTDLARARPPLPKYWIGRGIARIFEGDLTNALLLRQWSKARAVIRQSGALSFWSLVELLGRRLPVRICSFGVRRFGLGRRIAAPNRMVREFWLDGEPSEKAPAGFPPVNPSFRASHPS